MSTPSLIQRIVLLASSSMCLQAQSNEPTVLLQRALHLADLYNWADADQLFAQAEKSFLATGDKRNAHDARLGGIRANIERQQRTLPMVSTELSEELDTNPLLPTDKELRMFCLIVKGDIDTETNTGAMRRDWDEVHALARDTGNIKWQYRALAMLGVAAFYDGDLETARKNVGASLAAAMNAGDAGAQIRFLTMLGSGLLEAKMHEQALPYLEHALTLASATPNAGYQFATQGARIRALLGVGQIDSAQKLADEVLLQAQQTRRIAHEATVLGILASIARARNDNHTALSTLERAITMAESAGLLRLLARMQAEVADIYREAGDLAKAEHFAELAAASTQESGDIWVVPARLHMLAELQLALGKHAEADRVYDRAEAFVDSMVGNVSSVLEKTALIKASSAIYSKHFALIAEHFNDHSKAYSVVEEVRGRISTDLLMAGSVTSPEARKTERAVSRLRLKLMAAQSTDEVRRLRDEIFLVEQSRWVTPGVSILKTRARETIGIGSIQRGLAPSTVILEYVVANPSSYCLVISRDLVRIVRLEGKSRIDELVAACPWRITNWAGLTYCYDWRDARLPVSNISSEDSEPFANLCNILISGECD